ncbi:MAG: hypothetical protein WB239_09435 [Acidimicrobiia bacterium]
MTQNEAERLLELEESAQGAGLYRAPGEELQVEKARDQAEASGWIPEQAAQGERSRLDRARVRRHALREAMEALEHAIGRPVGSKDWARVVEGGLDDLEEAIRAHIEEVEAPDGLLAEMLDVAPRLSALVDTIRDEHRGLIESLDQSRRLLESGPVDGLAVRRRAVSLLGYLTRHRQHGSDLVYEAYLVDIAAAD